MTMLPSSVDIKGSLLAYLVIVALLIIYCKQIHIPSFDLVIRLLVILLMIEFIIYLLLSALGQKRTFKVK